MNKEQEGKKEIGENVKKKKIEKAVNEHLKLWKLMFTNACVLGFCFISLFCFSSP